VLVGKDQVFTDSCGRFSIREKHKTMPLHVDVDGFLTPGNFVVVEAPTSAQDGQPVRIVVKKL